MGVDNYIRKQVLFYSAMAAVGLGALFAGYVIKYETHVMSGIVFGFLPVGIGGLVILLYSRNHPKMIRNIEMEADERNIYLRSKSGTTAFWITFYYIFALTMFAEKIHISLSQFGVFTMVFMSIIYFLLIFINHRRY